MAGLDPDAPGGTAHAEQAAAWLQDALGVELPDGLLGLALTHRSFAYENGGLPTNERLEFLGDSVLGLVVTDELYRSQPDLPADHSHEVVDPRWAGLAGKLTPPPGTPGGTDPKEN